MSGEGGDKLKVLVVEDESLVAMLIEDVLAELGYDPIAVASRLDEALICAETLSFDFAVVDINLNGQRTDPVVEIMQRRGIPFLFASGYGPAGVTEGWAHVPVVQKPFQPYELASAIRRTLASP
jgi:CheY-like chemotaxis protein